MSALPGLVDAPHIFHASLETQNKYAWQNSYEREREREREMGGGGREVGRGGKERKKERKRERERERGGGAREDGWTRRGRERDKEDYSSNRCKAISSNMWIWLAHPAHLSITAWLQGYPLFCVKHAHTNTHTHSLSLSSLALSLPHIHTRTHTHMHTHTCTHTHPHTHTHTRTHTHTHTSFKDQMCCQFLWQQTRANKEEDAITIE